MSYDDEIDNSMAGWKVLATWAGAIALSGFLLAAVGAAVLAACRGGLS